MNKQPAEFALSGERIVWIDVARGFLMALVIMYHTLPPQIVANLINPAACTFFFLSGLFSKELPIRKGVKKRLKQLMVPYYTMAGFNILIWLIVKLLVTREELNFSIGSVLVNVLTVRTAVGIIPLNIIPLWFVPAVFVTEIYYSVLKKLNILPIGIVLGFVSMFFFYGALPFKIDVALAVLPYFAVGKVVKSLGLSSKRIPVLLTVTACVLFVSTAAFSNEVYLMEDYFGSSPLLYVIAALVGIIAVCGLAQILEKVKLARSILSLFGKHTLFILGYHIAAGFLVYPIFDVFGDPIEIMQKFWYIYWFMNMAVIYLMIRLIPKPAMMIMSGTFLVKRRSISTELV